MTGIPAKAGVEIIDIDRIYYLIDGLSNLEKDKAVKEGLRAGAYVFLAGGKRRLRQRMRNKEGVTGNLLRSFKVRVKRTKLGALAGFGKTTDVRKVGFGSDDGKGYHAHLVDKGTVLRRTKKSNAERGVMPANYFWTDTINQDSAKALDEVYKRTSIAVQRIRMRQQ